MDLTDTDLTLSRLPIARAWVAARQSRNRILGCSLFADPAWDILLDLFVCHVQQIDECISNACIASSVPAATAQRWIVTLQGQGLIERRPDPKDRRRVFVSLTPSGLQKMEAILDSVTTNAHLALEYLNKAK